ncbi:MAG: hypothetical protein FWG83_02020 [Oscillospiraceae bacterium]|nr:hypothetical protein [Oscillospiraceae bacterium]
MSSAAYLLLEDGTVFKGKAFGAKGEVEGEVVYSTNMTGFGESLTSPKHSDKILLQTFPLVGNVGVDEEVMASKCNAAGYILREYCDEPSNFRCESTLGEFMEKRGIVGLQGIDTRRLTHMIRDNGGSLKGKIVVGEE